MITLTEGIYTPLEQGWGLFQSRPVDSDLLMMEQSEAERHQEAMKTLHGDTFTTQS